MKTVCYSRVFHMVLAILLMAGASVCAQTTSWKGTVSTSWSTASNWTNGVPTATVDAIVGDASFTGTFQPTISTSAATKNLTIGATNAPVLTIAKALTVSGNLVINTGGTVSHRGVTLTVKGNWTNGELTPALPPHRESPLPARHRLLRAHRLLPSGGSV